MTEETMIAFEPEDVLKLDRQLCFPLYAAARKVTGLYTPFLKPLGLTYTQYLVFMVLWEKDGVPVSEVCSRLYLDNGTVTPLLKKLEAEGFVRRTRSTLDERTVEVTLTEKGRALKQKAAEIPAQAGAYMDLSPEDAAQLYRILYGILKREDRGRKSE